MNYPESVSKADQKILERIRKRRDLAYESEKERREKQLADLLFCDLDNQWPDEEKAKRKAQGRPCLTIDRTTPFIDQLVNEERQNRPSATVNPINDGADKDTAEILQGYFRHVELNSNADFAYDRASESQKRCGFGFMRLITDYVDNDSFDQDIKVVSVPNPFMFYLDSASTEPDGSDAEWGFGEEDFDQDDFKEKYPKASIGTAGTAEWTSIGDDAPGWVGQKGETFRVVEYYEIQKTPYTLCQLEGGNTVDKAKLKKGDKVAKDSDGNPKERASNKIKIKWFKVCANEILERGDVPGRYIPIVPVYGKELIVNGKRDYRGVVRSMKDVQRMVNVWKSAQTETIGLAPRAPWVVAIGALPEGDKTWSTANTTNYSALFYQAFDSEGRQMPQPTRNIQEPAIQAITVALKDTEEDMKAVTGMYDPSRGLADSSNQSGVAIKSLQNQGMTANFHYLDNFNRSLRHFWRIALYMVPEVVDAKRLLRIVGIDGKQSLVHVNTSQPVKDPRTGIEKIYDLTAGKYDVSIVAGPSFQSKRQENVAQLINLAKIAPAVAQNGLDILVRQMDFPAADELADRVTPPQFKKPDEGGAPISPQVQQQMQQAQEMVQALTQKVHDLTDQLETKQLENQAKISAAQIASATDIEVANIRAEAQIIQAKLQAKAPTGDANQDSNAVLAQLSEHMSDLQNLVLAHNDMLSQPASAPTQPMPGQAAPPSPAIPAGEQPAQPGVSTAGPGAGEGAMQ